MEAEREVADIKKAFFMKDHLHEKFFGIVSRVTKFGLYIELDPHFVEGILLLKEMRDDYYIFDEKKVRLIGRRSKAIIGIGDRLYVTVHEIDSQTSQIRLALVSNNGAADRAKKKHKHKNEKRSKGQKKHKR
jgi:ribonuclease R